MTTAAIVADIERETASAIERRLAEADARASDIVAAARADLRQAVEHARARAEPQARLDAARRVNAARLRLLERRADVATVRCESVFDQAARKLAVIAAGADPERWGAALGRLVDEASALAGPGATLVVRPSDRPIVERRAAAARAIVVAAPDAEPGIRATSSDGRIEVDARLGARLERARARLAEAVAVGLGPDG